MTDSKNASSALLPTVEAANILVVAGSILVFIPSLGAYVTPRVLGGGKHLMLMRPADDSDVVTLDFYAGKAIVLTVNTPLTD